MGFPELLRKLFQNDGAGPKLKSEIVPIDEDRLVTTDTDQTVVGKKMYNAEYSGGSVGFGIKSDISYDENPETATYPGIWMTDKDGGRLAKWECAFGTDGSRYMQLAVATPGTNYEESSSQSYFRFGLDKDSEQVLKVGTMTVGSGTKPVYLNSGTVTASSSTVGSSTTPVYLNSGTVTASSSTVGSSTTPVYLSSGTITAANEMVTLSTSQTISGSKTWTSQPVISRAVGDNSMWYAQATGVDGSETVKVGFGVGSGGWNRGVYDSYQGKWLVDYNSKNQLCLDGGGPLPGVIVLYAGTSIPTGWLQCNGSNVSRTTYSGLYDRIGTTWGSGDGSTTFTLPDFRNRFPEGVSTYAVGKSVSQGVPDATGYIGIRFHTTNMDNSFVQLSGTFSRSTGTGSYGTCINSVGSETNVGDRVAFKTSSSNSIYGASSSVQPAALAVYYIIKT